jgi:hypothetical protein
MESGRSADIRSIAEVGDPSRVATVDAEDIQAALQILEVVLVAPGPGDGGPGSVGRGRRERPAAAD